MWPLLLDDESEFSLCL